MIMGLYCVYGVLAAGRCRASSAMVKIPGGKGAPSLSQYPELILCLSIPSSDLQVKQAKSELIVNKSHFEWLNYRVA